MTPSHRREQDAAYFSTEWTQKNISSRGPLGAFYRLWGDGKQMVKGDRFDYFGIAGKSAQALSKEGYVVWAIHIIAEATDDGTPALTRYERFIVTCR